MKILLFSLYILASWLCDSLTMAQSSRVMSLSLQGQLPSLTLPADCLTTSIYSAETEILGISDNIYYTSSTLVQGCMTDGPRSTCCPSYESAGSYNVYYSPGVCPEGYTTLDLNIIVQAYTYSEFDEIKLGLKTGRACCPKVEAPVTYDLYSYYPSCLYSESTSYSTSDEAGPKVISTSRFWSASAYIIIPGTDFTTTFAKPTAISRNPESTSAEPGQSASSATATTRATGSDVSSSTSPQNTSGSTSEDEPKDDDKSGMPIGAIAGASAGGVLALVGCVYAAYRFGRRGRDTPQGDLPVTRPPKDPHGMGFSEIGSESIQLGKMGSTGHAPYPDVQEVDGNQYKGYAVPRYPEMDGTPYQGYTANKYPELDGREYQYQGPDRTKFQELDGSGR